MVEQTVLKVDRRERGWKLPQIGGWCADQAGELAKTPMRGGNRGKRTGQH
ncbi:hypothetical protein X743_28420 [Mesorhizobium sp. LNHC252B00]|nr:hypothetical protein X743_28420 [Mesorhizobium sp. LNHC252B00]